MMALNATDATERVEQLCLLTERLTELIAFEAQAFEQHRPQDAIEQLAETSKLANVYRHESSRVRANPGLVAEAPLALRTRLIRATEAFDAVLARQGRAIEEPRLRETLINRHTRKGAPSGSGSHNRTLTVGPGIKPVSAASQGFKAQRAPAGSCEAFTSPLPPVGTFTPP